MTNLMLPSEDQATAFAIMLSVGMPSRQAIMYFIPASEEWTPSSIEALHNKWLQSSSIKRAIKAQMGKSWEGMTLDERIRFAVDKQYSEMAYFIYSHNYSEVAGADKIKADTCRTALEAKLAGMAGKMGELEQFAADLRAGRITLPKVTLPPLVAEPTKES